MCGPLAGEDRGTLVRVAVADHAAYEAFLAQKLNGLPAVMRLESHLTMKKIKAESRTDRWAARFSLPGALGPCDIPCVPEELGHMITDKAGS